MRAGLPCDVRLFEKLSIGSQQLRFGRFLHESLPSLYLVTKSSRVFGHRRPASSAAVSSLFGVGAQVAGFLHSDDRNPVLDARNFFPAVH